MAKYVLACFDSRWSDGIESTIYDCESELRLALGESKYDEYGEYIEGTGKCPDLDEHDVNCLLVNGSCSVWCEQYRFGTIYYKLIEVV